MLVTDTSTCFSKLHRVQRDVKAPAGTEADNFWVINFPFIFKITYNFISSLQMWTWTSSKNLYILSLIYTKSAKSFSPIWSPREPGQRCRLSFHAHTCIHQGSTPGCAEVGCLLHMHQHGVPPGASHIHAAEGSQVPPYQTGLLHWLTLKTTPQLTQMRENSPFIY